MGIGNSKLSREELEEYADLTYFNEGEIAELYKRFESFDESVQGNKEARVPAAKIRTLPELKHNPFVGRLCAVFSSSEDHSMNFDEFLDMMNALSERAVFSLKATYAFDIFDFNENGFVDDDDIYKIVQCITKDPKGLDSENLTEDLIEAIMQEADLDQDHKLSRSEFEHVLSKSPDFLSSFKIRL